MIYVSFNLSHRVLFDSNISCSTHYEATATFLSLLNGALVVTCTETVRQVLDYQDGSARSDIVCSICPLPNLHSFLPSTTILEPSISTSVVYAGLLAGHEEYYPTSLNGLILSSFSVSITSPPSSSTLL